MCTNLTYPVVKHDETNIKFDYGSHKPEDWNTETHETFSLPRIDEKRIGKRRELLIKYFKTRAAKDALEDILGKVPLPESRCFTEYIDNYCDSDFTPSIENPELDEKELEKNPLCVGDVKSYYKEQFDKGKLKAANEFRNPKRPFARRSLLTMPIEEALEVPLNGI